MTDNTIEEVPILRMPNEKDFWLAYKECSICEKEITDVQIADGDAVIKLHLTYNEEDELSLLDEVPVESGRFYFDLRHSKCFSERYNAFKHLTTSNARRKNRCRSMNTNVLSVMIDSRSCKKWTRRI